MEKNYLNKKKGPFRNRIFKFTFPQFAIGTAAAFVIVFAGSFALGSRANKSDIIPVPEIGYSVDINNITPVRASDNATTAKSLESYSLDEILKNLDARGYDVDIRLKSIQPVTFDEATGEVEPIVVDPVVEEPVVEEPVVEEPAVEEPIVIEPVVVE